ncbi:MAG: preprotein translocase subunit SecE [Elusimicrobia bacterium HGW-Elusimicrobia-1]|jgi:preprotein translocase subunit SecE|nr:MAG: preprotein translocase subunit SecE [Elusimicrobia bacterium HGW-Elusimicrobia-1]
MNSFVHSLKSFFIEAYEELKKVSWLSKKEVIASTIGIIIIVVVASLYIGVVDFLLSKTLGVFIIR